MPHDVIVIGAGVAGLSAATSLAEQGVRVRVLEARPSGGGRCSTFTDPATGERVDNGQHVLIGCYDETFRFLRRIGSASSVRLQPNLAVGVIDRAGRASRFVCPPWPAPFHLAGGILRWRALGWRERLGLVQLLPQLRAPAVAGEGQTVRMWLRSHGQRARITELLWEPLAVAALNPSIDAAAAEPFRQVLRRMFTTDRRDSALGLPEVPLEELFVQPATGYLQAHGGTVDTGSRARVELAGGDVIVRLRDEGVKSRVVIVATAWHALPDVLPPTAALRNTIDAAAATAASAIVTVNVWLDRRVEGDAFIGLPGRAMQWVFDKQQLFGGGSTHLSVVSSGAGELAALGNDEITAIARRELAESLPALRDASITRAVVVRERRASFSLAPGQPRRPGTHTGVDGLLLAGDWIDTGLPATIESAAMSGHRAAAAAMQHLARH